MATQQATRPSAPATPPVKRKSVQRTRLWGTLLALPTAWIVGFFVSSMVIVVLLSFGRTQSDGRPVFGTRRPSRECCRVALFYAHGRGIWRRITG